LWYYIHCTTFHLHHPVNVTKQSCKLCICVGRKRKVLLFCGSQPSHFSLKSSFLSLHAAASVVKSGSRRTNILQFFPEDNQGMNKGKSPMRDELVICSARY